jgi:hypothetical protein
MSIHGREEKWDELRPVGRPRDIWEDNIKMDLNELE